MAGLIPVVRRGGFRGPTGGMVLGRVEDLAGRFKVFCHCLRVSGIQLLPLRRGLTRSLVLSLWCRLPVGAGELRFWIIRGGAAGAVGHWRMGMGMRLQDGENGRLSEFSL